LVNGVSVKEYESNKKTSDELNSFVNEDFNFDFEDLNLSNSKKTQERSLVKENTNDSRKTNKIQVETKDSNQREEKKVSHDHKRSKENNLKNVNAPKHSQNEHIDRGNQSSQNQQQPQQQPQQQQHQQLQSQKHSNANQQQHQEDLQYFLDQLTIGTQHLKDKNDVKKLIRVQKNIKDILRVIDNYFDEEDNY